MGVTYEHLHIYPYKLVRLSELSLHKQINEHTRLRFTGIVSEGKKDSYVELTHGDTPVELYQVEEDGSSKPLFRGLALSIEIRAVRGVYYIEVEAVSHTYLLDIKRTTRSFQNVRMTIPELLQQVGANYPGLDVMDEATDGARLSRFALQYQETDWEFLRRMASRYHTSLMPAAQFDKPKFYFGIAQGSMPVQLPQTGYTVRKQVEPFRYFTENEQANVRENDFITYELESEQVYELGSHLYFQGKSLFVREVWTEMTNGIVRHRYKLCSHQGLRQKAYENESLIGASLSGRVIGVSGDKVKVHFEFDSEQGVEEARWFRYMSAYTAEGHTGWYVMPEIGDPVTVYFPGSKEEEGIASGAARERTHSGHGEHLQHPEVKIFRTPYGKEIRLAPDEVVITGKEGAIYIRLNEREGIHVASSQAIRITADGDLSISAAKKMVLSAGGEMNLSCKGSQLHLGGEARLTGGSVKSN